MRGIACAILVILIVLVIWYEGGQRGLWRTGRETMTKIRRGVGFANEANETQVAAGVVNSAPIMDYTHTYWDGEKVTSCDECPNQTVCPQCPQYKEHMSPGVTTGAALPTTRVMSSPGPDYAADHSLDPAPDDDDERTGRRLGAVSGALPGHSLSSTRCASARANAGEPISGAGSNIMLTSVPVSAQPRPSSGIGGDIAVGQREIRLGRNMYNQCDGDIMELLYTNVMGLGGGDPDPICGQDCEFYSQVGYLYREDDRAGYVGGGSGGSCVSGGCAPPPVPF